MYPFISVDSYYHYDNAEHDKVFTSNYPKQYDYQKKIGLNKQKIYKNRLLKTDDKCVRKYMNCNTKIDLSMYGLNSIL